MIIRTQQICKVFNIGNEHLEVLKGIDFLLEKTEYVAIMGASGSGKSTFMNILGCLDRPTSGEYYLDNVDVSRMSKDELAEIRNKKIGFVFQAFNLLPKLTSVENVALPMMYAGIPKVKRIEKAKSALEKVGLGHRFYHKPNELSGGQKQRVAIARALVNEPSIIFADEPTGNLDSKSSVEIMEIFQSLNNDGVTIVMVTHEPDIAMHSKRTVVFRDGIIISDIMVENRILTGGSL